MANSDILASLCSHLADLALDPALPVAWPNVDFTPPSNGYLAVSHFPASVTQIETGSLGRDRYRGLFQVSVLKKHGIGSIAGGLTAANDIAAHFDRGSYIETDGGLFVRIRQTPFVGPGFKDGSYWQTPVSVLYDCDSAPL
jgi:hypothetical protein